MTAEKSSLDKAMDKFAKAASEMWPGESKDTRKALQELVNAFRDEIAAGTATVLAEVMDTLRKEMQEGLTKNAPQEVHCNTCGFAYYCFPVSGFSSCPQCKQTQAVTFQIVGLVGPLPIPPKPKKEEKQQA